MSRKEELLDKLVAGGLVPEEAAELRELVLKDDREAKLRLVTAMGVGAAGALTLPALLDLDFSDLLELRSGPAILEVEPQQEAPAQSAQGNIQPQEEYPPPESPEEEALEMAREASTPAQVGAQPMSQPREMGAPVRKVRAPLRR